MTQKRLIQLFLIAAVVFVAFGDSFKFLPKPARDASVSSRNFVVSLWPSWLRPRDTNEQRERQVEQLERGNPKP